MRLLMCSPKYYGIQYEINPWMHLYTKSDHAQATLQWNALYATLQTCGAEIDLVDPQPGWPDMTFAANAGLYYQDNIIISHFKFAERQGEAPFFAEWFDAHGFNILNSIKQTSPYFEGAGDALLAGKKLFAGYGFRSDKKFYDAADYLDQKNLVYCELINPYFYHIDTCFCPLTPDLAIWYPDAFSQESQTRMQNEIELIAVQEHEAKRFACNAIVIDKQIVIPSETPMIAAELIHRGYTVHACVVDEFLKAGGACKCLTLRID